MLPRRAPGIPTTVRILHAHNEFEEAIYVLADQLEVFGDSEVSEAGPESIFVAPPGQQHGFRNLFADHLSSPRRSRGDDCVGALVLPDQDAAGYPPAGKAAPWHAL